MLVVCCRWLFVASGKKMCSCRCDLHSTVMLLGSESYEDVMLNIISKQSVCLCACERSESKQKVSQTKLPDWELNLKHYIHWYLCCSLSSWDRQSIITVNTWAASRLYTPAPLALHLGQETLRSFPYRWRAAWSRQIITRRPGGTWGLEFCQTLLH